MKKIQIALATMIWLLWASGGLQATVYRIEKKCYKKDAYQLSGYYGIKGDASGGKAEVRMYYKPQYNGSTSGTDQSLIYGAYSDENTPTWFRANPWYSDGSLHWYCIPPFFTVGQFWCADEMYEQIASTDFKQPLIRAFNSAKDDFSDVSIDVVIELELTGGVTLADIKEIKLPGVERLYPQDFIRQSYSDAHYCYSNGSTSYCQELDQVRSIPDLSKTDVIIQAHRGIWGAPGGYNENSLGAMQTAKTKGIFLVESDIMPYGQIDTANVSSPSFAQPDGLVCFHDYNLDRYTNTSGNLYNMTKSQLDQVKLNDPRSNNVSTQGLLYYDALLDFVKNEDMFLCVDMKNLEPKGAGAGCTRLCAFEDAANKTKSLMLNWKKAIEIAHDKGLLGRIAIKTYEPYNSVRALVDVYGLSENLFNQILWAPMFAPNDSKWQVGNGNNDYDPEKIKDWLFGWFAHNESVLYYEINFFNDYDGKTSVALENEFCYTDPSGEHCVSVMEYIYHMTGRRPGIFSEEPVGSKGTVNRWGTWKMKDPTTDRRGDHLWLLEQPFMKHAVITTDRSDVWEQLND